MISLHCFILKFMFIFLYLNFSAHNIRMFVAYFVYISTPKISIELFFHQSSDHRNN